MVGTGFHMDKTGEYRPRLIVEGILEKEITRGVLRFVRLQGALIVFLNAVREIRAENLAVGTGIGHAIEGFIPDPGGTEIDESDFHGGVAPGAGVVDLDVLGPVAGVGYGIFSAVVDDNPDTWKKWERAMPSALKSASQGIRRSQRGAEEFRGGGTIAPFDPNNPEDRMGLAANMLGFQPTKVGEAYAVIGTKENLRRYWTGRHAMVMENWAFAMRSQDQELIADAKRNMEEYNESVPDPMLRLTPKKIRQSMKVRGQRMKLREMGLPNEKGYRRLYEEIDQIYGLQST